MPRADKTLKTRKPITFKMGQEEKQALEAISHVPRFPARLVGLKKSKK